MKRNGQEAKLALEHWSGTGWRRVTVPRADLAAFVHRTSRGVPPLAAIGASARDLWAINQMTGAWLRWNGREWNHGLLAQPAGSAAIIVTSVKVLSRKDVWAFGARVTAQGKTFPFAERFDGRRWTPMQLPPVPGLVVSAASAIHADDVWAVIGYAGQFAFPAQGNGGALAHWNGSRWRLAPLPAQFTRHGDPTSIHAISDRDIWIGGGTRNRKEGLTEAAAHWNGSRWQLFQAPVAPSPSDCVLRTILPDKAGIRGLSLCFGEVNPGSVRSRLWQLTSGQWTGPVRPRPAGTNPVFLQIALTGRDGSVWAAGFSESTGIVALHGPTPR